MAVKAGFDALQAARLTYDQFARHRAACVWCLIASAATFATSALVVPEARSAVRHVVRGKSEDAKIPFVNQITFLPWPDS